MPALVMFLLLLTFLPTALAGKGYGVEVRRTGPAVVAANPGQVVTAAFSVRSASPDEQELTASLELPAGWRSITPATPFDLQPGTSVTRLVAFAIPADTPPGTFDLRYRVSGRLHPDVLDEDHVSIEVAQVDRVSLVVADAPDLVVAGETGTCHLQVTNEGNAAVHVILDAHGEKGLEVAPAEAELQLGARETGIASLSVGTRADEQRPTTRAVWVIAHVAGAPGVEARVTLALPIVPRGARSSEVLRHLPSHVTLYSEYGAGRVAFQPEITAAGPVDDGGKVAVDLLARGPDTSSLSAYGLRDEYRLSMDAPFAQVQLGDQVYALSPLTSPFRYGRGVGAVVHPGRFDIGSHYVMTRYEDPERTELAGFVGWHPTDRVRTSLQVLQLGGDRTDTIGSVSGSWIPASPTRLEAELGMDRAPAGTVDEAVRGALSTSLWKRLELVIEDIYAGPGFHGYYADVHEGDATALLHVNAWASLSADYQFIRRNLSLLTANGTADRNQSASLTAALSLPSAWRLDMGARAARAFDALAPTDFDYREAAARVGISTFGKFYSLSFQGVAGPHADDLAGELYLVDETDAYLSVFPTPRQSFDISASWSNRDLDRSIVFAPNRSVSIGASVQPLDQLYIDCDIRRSLEDRIAAETDARVRYIPKKGPEVTASYRMRVEDQGATPEHDALLVVSLPVNIPIGRSTRTAAIRGRIYDADLPGQPGIAGVVVSAGGAYAMTSADGTYLLANLPPGPQALEVDRRRVGVGRIANVPQPLAMVLRGGRTERQDLGITTASTLTGRVIRIPAATDTKAGVVALARVEPGEPQGAAGVVLAISDGQETVTARTAADGRFFLSSLRPGRWTVRILTESLPVPFEPVLSEQVITLASGAALEMGDVAVRPQLRPIQMQDPLDP